MLELTEHRVADIVFKEYGTHIPETGLKGTVYVLQKRVARLTTLLLYAATVLVWGSTWIMMKFQLGVVAPAASLTYRYFLAGCLVLIGARAGGQGHPARPAPAPLVRPPGAR